MAIEHDKFTDSYYRVIAISRRMDELIKTSPIDWDLYDLLSEMRVSIISETWKVIQNG